jgi:hypothetical protein
MLRWCAAAQFDVRYQISDRKANVVVCLSGVVPPIHYDQWTDKLGGSWVGRTRTCSFRVRAQNKAKRKCIEVTRMNPEHSGCLGNGNVKTRGISTQRFLHAAVPEIMPVDRSITPKQIVKAVQHAFHQTIPYQQGKRTLNTLQRNDIDLEREQFRQLGALI